MKIWIDGYEANVPQRLGSGQVAFALLKNLELYDHDNSYTILLPNNPMPDLPKEREGWRYKVLKPSKLWTRIALPLKLFTSRDKPDIFFSPTHYIPRFSPVKRVMMVFDLAYLHFKEMFKMKDLYQLKNWTEISMKNADHIITISNSTKKDILKHANVAARQVSVAYPGYDKHIFHPVKDRDQIKQLLERYQIKSPFIIYIGTIQPRKNLIKLIEAVARIEEINLVIVGKTTGEGRQGWMYDSILKKPVELGIEKRVIFTGFAPTEDLPYLLSGSVAYVLPSLWEGFGIPVVEAMACGVPVIVSNVSSLPEIVGNAGLFVDPNSIDQIEQAIRTVTTDKKLHLRLAKRSLEGAKKFSWEKMAKDVKKILEEVAKR